MKKMIITIGLFLTINTIFANTDGEKTSPREEIKIELTQSIAPCTPMEATFEDVEVIDVKDLSPVTPKEATFEDEN